MGHGKSIINFYLQKKLQDVNITLVLSISTIGRILKNQCLTTGRAGHYEEDYPM